VAALTAVRAEANQRSALDGHTLERAASAHKEALSRALSAAAVKHANEMREVAARAAADQEHALQAERARLIKQHHAAVEAAVGAAVHAAEARQAREREEAILVAQQAAADEAEASLAQLTEQLEASRSQLETSRSQAEQLRMEHAQAGAKCTVLDAELRHVSEGAERLRRALTVAAEALVNERKRSEETSGALQAAGEAAARSREEAEHCREHASASRDEWQRSLSELEVRQLELSQQCARSEAVPRRSSRFVNWSSSACSGRHRSSSST
jgi:methyl-accepting chemotaxis protein